MSPKQLTKAQTEQWNQARQAALSNLENFIKLIHPHRVLGECHTNLIQWWNRPEAKSHQLVLLPRDHQKSALVAYRAAWEITKNPAVRILYISSTSNLATKQLKFIKDILTSDKYRYYWPDMVNEDESKREKWTEGEISVDHPIRKAESVRDPTIFTAGLTTNIVGLHCDIAILDDVVVDDSAYTEEGRDKVRTQASYLASIAGTDSRLWAVGTRYHPRDLYNDFKEMVVEIVNDEGEIINSEHLYEVYEKQVEDRGDGTGTFLWPRTQRADGKWFGFNQKILATKKSQYVDATKFRAQYYNNPNDVSSASISADMFQYYNRALVKQVMGRWYFKEQRLNVFASIDFAYSLGKRADYTAIVVVGVDAKNNYYVLDIDRFRTDTISTYFDHILRMYSKWGFRKLRAEVATIQKAIVKDLKENYIKVHGLPLAIDEFNPPKNMSKEERIEATLQARYSNRQMWHYSGGLCSTLEEELVLQKPPHDDIKDCLAACIDICVPPGYSVKPADKREQMHHSRFGGIA